MWQSVAVEDQCRFARRSKVDTSVARVESFLVIKYNPGSKVTTVDESWVVPAEYLRIDTRPTSRRD